MKLNITMKTILRINAVLFSLSLIVFTNCKDESKDVKNSYDPIETEVLTASVETDPVIAGDDDDAADDPAIWINWNNPGQSLIVGSNKKAGVNLYDLDGNEVFFIEEGLINNVDLRYGFDLNGKDVDIAGGSNRTLNTISLFIIDGNEKSLERIHGRDLESSVDEVYGFCMYKSAIDGQIYAFVNGKNGVIEQWRLFPTDDNKVDGEVVRTLSVDSQPEGMVADDEEGILYVGEEGAGIWKFNAEPDGGEEKSFVEMSDESNPAIEFDIEGLAILYQPEGKGYLIASSQGNNSYAVFEREGDNKYLMSFSIEDGQVDGVEETDGLDITHFYLNEEFPAGILVVQDGFNYNGDTLMSQNFKVVDFRRLAYLIEPEMELDNEYMPYKK
jgi:3-phytase